MERLSGLNEYQKTAIMDDSKACLVNACVGSGKTTVLVNKVLYLCFEKKIPLSDIVVLTFTNKAANEIIDRLKNVDIDISDEDTRYFGTFHSVALKMLKTILPIKEIGYNEEFAVMDVDEENELAQSIIVSNNLNIKYVNHLNKRIEAAKKGKTKYGIMKDSDDIQYLIELLSEIKQNQNKMDFDDLIYYATLLIKKVSYRPRWIIVDEFQDTNDDQLLFIDSLVGEYTQLFAVGDPNQIIYTWRGSCKDIFDRYKAKYNATELSLPENYRSTSNIIGVAKCFLDDPSELCTAKTAGNKILIKDHYNPFSEAQYLSDRISELVKQGIPFCDIAIFYRTQKQSRVIEDVFEKSGIPFEVSLKKTLKDIPVLNWFIHLLKIAVNPYDTESAILAISDSKFGTYSDRRKAKQVINNMIGSYGLELTFDLIGEENSSCELIEKAQSFKEWCKSSSKVSDVYDYFDLDSYLHPTSASYKENKEMIEILLDKINDHILKSGSDLYKGTQDFINSSALYGLDILSSDESMSNSVKLMTLHAAKGLEFRYVFIIGVNYGLIPLRTTQPDEEKEERRLFFVGITRAMENLEISFYTCPDDERVYSGPSKFISYIPRHLCEYDGDYNIGPDRSNLQQMRKQLVEMMHSKENALDDGFTEILSLEEQVDDNYVSPVNTAKTRKFHHDKYGIGDLVEEDDTMITICFEGYGEKQFVKAFSDLTEITI